MMYDSPRPMTALAPHAAGAREPGAGRAMTMPATDPAGEQWQRRADCARIEQVFPGWLVMWGAHSRCFWGYPLFDVPAGTMASAENPAELAGRMRAIQRATLG